MRLIKGLTKELKKINMKECKPEFIDLILTELSNAPSTQIDKDIRERVKNCNGTYGEKYDTIVEISKESPTKISFFVRELCQLDKYYLRPN